MTQPTCLTCKWFRPADPARLFGSNLPALCKNSVNDFFSADVPGPGFIMRMPRVTTESGTCGEHTPAEKAKEGE